MFRPKTAAEQLRENKRLIDRSIRELDRERVKMEAYEKQTIAEMKKLAKAGQKVRGSCWVADILQFIIPGSVYHQSQGYCENASCYKQILYDALSASKCQHSNDGTFIAVFPVVFIP